MVNNMVNNNRRTKLFLKILFGQLAVGTLITVLALSVLFYAQGNRFDFKTFQTIKTGQISIEYLPRDSQIYINDKRVEVAKSFAKNLSPGWYLFKVAKEGYTPWQVNLNIASRSVNIYKNVMLFKSSPQIEVLTDQRKISTLSGPSDQLASRGDKNGLFANGFEIWLDQKIVARFSTQINQVVWYSDRAHILYQQGKEIRVIEKNGMNDTLLATLSKETPTRFAVSSDGVELYFLDDNTYKVARIR